MSARDPLIDPQFERICSAYAHRFNRALTRHNLLEPLPFFRYNSAHFYLDTVSLQFMQSPEYFSSIVDGLRKAGRFVTVPRVSRYLSTFLSVLNTCRVAVLDYGRQLYFQQQRKRTLFFVSIRHYHTSTDLLV